MKKRLSHISVLQQGIVSAVLYAVLSLIFVPFVVIAELVKGQVAGAIFVIFAPIIYAILGFIFGIIFALIYNLVAKWTGGFEFTLTYAP